MGGAALTVMNSEGNWLTAMGAPQKFLFNTSFDEEEQVEAQVEEAAAPEPEPEPPPPMFTEEQLNVTRAEGFAVGRDEGQREAMSAIQTQTLGALKQITADISELFAIQEQANETLTRDAVNIAEAVVRKLFPDLNARNAIGEIARLVRVSLQYVMEEPRVLVRVNPTLRDSIAGHLEGLRAGGSYEGEIVVLPEDGIAPGDCRVEWAGGGAERDTAALWQTIDEIIERNLGIESAAPAAAAPAAGETRVEAEPPSPVAAQSPKQGTNP